VIAACFRPTAESLERTRAPIAVATTSHIKRYIEQHLASPELSPASICAAFGLSRATLYRLFEPLGGIASSIRERRLARTYAELIHPANQHRRISDIAFDWGFTNGAHFSRNFRRAFDMAPSELRALADGGRNAVEAGPSRAPVSRDFVDWIARLE
jgi:AraC-like DNA-binding protein